MKILVCPPNTSMGGSQLNAIELADAVRRHGHEVMIYAPRGVLAEKVISWGIPFVQAPSPGNGKEWRSGLNRLVKDEGVDLIHTYEWGPSLEASFSAGIRTKVPVLASVMSMGVPEFLPRHLPLLVGTPALATELAWQHRTVFLLEPRVDMEKNKSVDTHAERTALGINDGEIVVSIVSMLTTELEKLQGVLEAIALLDRMADTSQVRLLIAGAGEGLNQVKERAEEVNARHGRVVIDVLGHTADPRPVYAAADIVLGMGASAIKAMAFSKPLVVQGEAGFWKTLTEENSEGFLRDGWFGYEGQGAADLERELQALINEPQRRASLGAYGRNLVERRYCLDSGAKELSKIYLDLLAHRSSASLATRATSLLRSAVEVSRFRTSMKSGALTEREKWSHSGVGL